MPPPIIEAIELTKRYRLGAIGATSLRESFGRWWARVRDPSERKDGQEFEALRDVSFTVQPGEIVGVIGRNGAGKSTLLKILSRITDPTSGRAVLRGRVASLLEVGTGFHPDLTGRENVFLNGAILGMTKPEIRRKFDEIVAFAEVEQFIDTPVKRYSSGMYVRLAFAVAAHLEPEILIVDEVLAVGDAAFQKKCLGKMQNVSTQAGRTVIFVSHNMSAVVQLTSRCLLLEHGQLAFAGSPNAAVERYLNVSPDAPCTVFNVENLQRPYPGTEAARVVELRYEKVVPQFAADEPFAFLITIRAKLKLERLRTSVTIFSNEGTPVGGCFSPDDRQAEAGETVTFRLTIARHQLAPGHYYCDIGIGKGDPRSGHVDYDVVPQTLQFEVLPTPGQDGLMSYWHPGWGRIIYPELRIEPANR
jgi:lipopolysaccharide transport system ATP-binding protein